MSKIVVIISNTRAAAERKLKTVAQGVPIRRLDGFTEAHPDGHRLMAFGGSAEEVCWLRGLGFTDIEIITVGDGISEAMQKRINHVRSAGNGRER